ncbi:hypothetical protein J7E96_19485 [Streptomyces sp. ISL-96]|uniref:hypothetical protein n=1 Tax=Streptomyces sp. ISL-96 TaxID=2819191 RepID=UPI001BEB24C0|nr:hypothetical protein [Streptomyces sp. ISL-96]MBT2490658.1 hypothetical protein [Streptomyces sp. ISL-96]
MDITLDAAYWYGLLLSFVLPVLVGLVTTRVTHAGTKAVVLLALAAADSFIVELAAGGPGWDVGNALVLTLVSFVIAVASHFGLWKPTGVARRAQDAFVKAA